MTKIISPSGLNIFKLLRLEFTLLCRPTAFIVANFIKLN